MAERRYINGYMDREDIILLFRDEAGRLMKKTCKAMHVAFFKSADIDAHIKAEWDRDQRIVKAETSGDWVRVQFTPGYWDPNMPNKFTGRDGAWQSHRVEVCKEWENRFKLKSYEADVSPLRRLMSDTGIQIERPKRCYIDLETDSRASFPIVKSGRARILSYAIVSETGEKWSGVLNQDSNTDEIRMLTKMWKELDQFDQVVAWNGEGFDFPVMKERTKFLEIEVKDMRRWLFLDQMVIFKKYNMSSSGSGDEKQSFKLESIAQSLLGEGKHDVDGSKTWEYWRNGGTEREALLQYNIQDTDLLRRVEEKTGYLALFQQICEVVGCFPDTKSVKPTQQVDGYLLRLGAETGFHFGTKWYGQDAAVEQFAGAYVMPPKTDGIEKDVFVADFASLYPSIMVTFNLSPDTKIGVMAEGETRLANECLSPATNVLMRNDFEGILTTALKNLMSLRTHWKQVLKGCAPGTVEYKDALRRTNGYKLIANSFYGVMGTIYSRYYDKDLVESTTQNGAWLIKTTIAAAEERLSCRAVYCDTDSCFITGTYISKFKEFVNWCNTVLYPDLLSALGCRENMISLAFDKHFSRIVFVSSKRYIGQYADAKEGAEPEIKGLEYKRGDANKTMRSLQGEAIRMICDGQEEPTAFIEMLDRYKERVLNEEMPVEEVVSTKSLTKDIAEYVTKTKKDGTSTSDLPHVAVAKILLERGQDVVQGSRVGYVVVDGDVSPMEVIPADDYVGVFDRFFFWENLVYPATERLLKAAFPRHDWSAWEKVRPPKSRRKQNPDQMGLFAALSGVPETTVKVVEKFSSQLGKPMVAPMRKKAAS
jgi:DNA polymerase I